MSEVTYDPASHYDRVTDAWTLLLGDDLHYGLFTPGVTTLSEATAALTQAMVDAAEIQAGVHVLDVGCGTGAPACHLASIGARVTGISTSDVGLATARARAASMGLDDHVAFENRDGMDNGFPDVSFDRVWVLESSHLMPQRDRLIADCSRVLREGGRLALCDIVLRRPMPFEEVRRLRKPLSLLREVFGAARMELLATYAELAVGHGLVVERADDLTELTRPTFAHWRANAERHHAAVVGLLGEEATEHFVESTHVLEGFWDDGTLGYGLLAATKG